MHRILKEERDLVIASRPLEATAFEVEGIRMAYVFYESGLSINVMYTIADAGKRAVGFKLSEGMEVPEELASRFKFARQKLQAGRHDPRLLLRDQGRVLSQTVAFRLWPPVAVYAPLLVGWLVTRLAGDPVDLRSWRFPLGWALVAFFACWNGWSLWLFGRHETGLLPGQATQAMIEEGPFRLSRNPLYVGLLALYLGLALLAPTFWGLVLFPAAVLLVLWGAIRPEERFLHERFGASYDDYRQRVRRWL